MRAALVIVFASLAIASAQSTISTTDHVAYAANAGWIDFRPSAPDGVVATETYLSGNAYAANFGWIKMGNGTPANQHTWANISATDFGVNVDSNGNLTGYAYAANAGWITFEQTHGQPKLNLLTGQFTGRAYAANLGWISLENASCAHLYTQTIATPDSDGDGISDAWEMQKFGNLTTANATSDTDQDGKSDKAEFIANTNPTNANDYLRITAFSHAGGDTTSSVTFTSNPSRRYKIEYDDDLLGTWTNSALGTFDPAIGSTTNKVVTHAGAGKLFFRVSAVRPLQ